MTLWAITCQAPLSPDKNSGVGCHAVLQEIFPTQGSNPHLLTFPALAGGFFTTSATWEAGNHQVTSDSVPPLRSVSKMGNGSVKPKHSKNADGQPGNLTASALRSRVTELERELRRKDAEIQEREYHLKELREQLSKQTVAVAELTEELQSKCIQLNKLQDVVRLQGGSLPRTSPGTVPLEAQRETSGLVSLHSRRGAKAGVSAEPTTRTYDLNRPPEFSFEKARVRKDSR